MELAAHDLTHLKKLIEASRSYKLFERKEDFSRQKEQNAFNIFSVSTYTAHLENFHSDMLVSLLNPRGLHGEKPLFCNCSSTS
jgi:hypothetical protein